MEVSIRGVSKRIKWRALENITGSREVTHIKVNGNKERWREEVNSLIKMVTSLKEHLKTISSMIEIKDS